MPQWITLGMFIATFGTFVVNVMLPYAYSNEHTNYQIERLVELKTIMQRLANDKRILLSNTRRIGNLILRKSVFYLQRETSSIEDKEERLAEMEGMIEKSYNIINEAIDLLEKDITYKPKELLGVAMYPDRIWGTLITILTLGGGFLSSKLTAA